MLDRAEPGQTIAVVQLADGADVVAPARPPTRWPGTGACGARSREQIDAGRDDLSLRPVPHLAGLPRAASRRAGPTRRRRRRRRALRTEQWKFGFIGSRDETCGFVHLPPAAGAAWARGAVDHMEPVRMADVPATIATFTVDRLAYC